MSGYSVAQLTSLTQISQGQNKGTGRAAFLSGYSVKEFASQLIQVLAETISILYILCGLYHLKASNGDSSFSCASNPSDYPSISQKKIICF